MDDPHIGPADGRMVSDSVLYVSPESIALAVSGLSGGIESSSNDLKMYSASFS
jgi:hypothetical protein